MAGKMHTITLAQGSQLLESMNIIKTALVESEEIDWDNDGDDLDSCKAPPLFQPSNPETVDLMPTCTQLRKELLVDLLEQSSAVWQSDRWKLERANYWKQLLGVRCQISAEEYVSYVSRGPSKASNKISDDVHRTFMHNDAFNNRVPHANLDRFLNAFEWKMRLAASNDSDPLTFSYVQGMNLLAGVFLYVMPELDAFHCFTQFITKVCPAVIQPNLEGVRAAARV